MKIGVSVYSNITSSGQVVVNSDLRISIMDTVKREPRHIPVSMVPHGRPTLLYSL